MAGNQLQTATHTAEQAAEHAKAGARAYESGDLASALGSYFMALALQPNHPVYLHTAVMLIGITDGYALPPIIKKILGAAAQSPTFSCQPLATAVHNDFVHDPLSRQFLELVEQGGDALEDGLAGDTFASVLNDRLLRAVLQRAVIVSPRIEALVTGLRRHALSRAAAGAANTLLGRRLDFFACLAAQCFNTEYAFHVTDEEEAWLAGLLSGDMPSDGTLALIAAYRPLYSVVGKASVASDVLAELVRQQIDEPRREQEIRKELPKLTPIEGFSSRMQGQYESFPYPRWFFAEYARARTFRQVVEERFPHLTFSDLPKYNANILVPGCGTGHQLAQLVAMLKNPRITAIDLSGASLAYARRKLDEKKIKIHRFGLGDILALGEWTERFDFIECMGVLHHLERPEEGLHILVRLLEPHGILRLGLYSERARRHVVEARRLVAEQGFPSSPEGVRAARKLIMSLPEDHPVHEIMQSQDFYSIAGLHDLIFNLHECRYTPLGLKALLEEAGLEFLGFDHPDPGVPVRFRERFPDDAHQTDLANWELFDIEFPDTFASMYQFWCRPIRA